MMRLLKSQAAVRTLLRTFIELRKSVHEAEAQAEADGTPPPRNNDAEKLKQATAALAKLFPEPAKAAELLQKLRYDM